MSIVRETRDGGGDCGYLYTPVDVSLLDESNEQFNVRILLYFLSRSPEPPSCRSSFYRLLRV